MASDQNLTILAVDDEDIILEAIEGYLTIEGWTVIRAVNGKDALEKFNKDLIDIVLTDLLMPVMGGVELLASVKEQSPDTPVIIISGAGNLHDSISVFQQGAWDYILKPIDFSLLTNSIIRACEQKRLLRENRQYRENLEEEIKKRTKELRLRTTELEKSNEQLSKEIQTRKETEERQKLLEAEVQKAKNIESLGNLAGGIAHDFNNLLSALVGYIDFAAIANPDNEELTETLHNAKIITRMASDLTRQLITFSKGGSPVFSQIEASELVHQAIHLSSLDIEKIVFQNSIPRYLWAIKGDQDQLSIVLRNIYFNAIESMPKGGTLTTKLSNIDVPSNNSLYLTEGKYLKIYIRDEGDGISRSDLLQIFEPYFTTKSFDSKKGKGLGLSVSYSIVKKHGGNITVDSELGKGTEVSIYLPSASHQS